MTPTPCLRCGSADRIAAGQSVVEIYVYIARLTLDESGTDLAVATGPNSVPDGFSGRICARCTPIVRPILVGESILVSEGAQ